MVQWNSSKLADAGTDWHGQFRGMAGLPYWNQPTGYKSKYTPLLLLDLLDQKWISALIKNHDFSIKLGYSGDEKEAHQKFLPSNVVPNHWQSSSRGLQWVGCSRLHIPVTLPVHSTLKSPLSSWHIPGCTQSTLSPPNLKVEQGSPTFWVWFPEN